ncbi:GNAT family N-acetyltransferase [Luteipulveratus mongoliensis]|uniref:GNAT family N-acetyltransferase n=1 Tax=Luteipulveratus mongoliensis TaxID=571913 RepID=UPI000698DA1C|nr:GNAT family N-acetyltransferase [Luteipulveratus mongoliensis]
MDGRQESDDLGLLLAEAGVIWDEDTDGLLLGDTVLVTARTTDGRLGTRPGAAALPDGGGSATSSCVSYLINEIAAPPLPSGLSIRTDDDNAWLATRRPADWEPDEWLDLLAGTLGPWAIVTDAHGVASLCFSARLNPRGAEAGVRTAEQYRGHGLASITTAAWAEQLHDRRIPLFYSTSESNPSSQRVAARLGLHPLGRLWRVYVEESEPTA